MTIAQEEIFGPVLSVIPFDDEEDAIRIANDSVYGLAGNVMSGSLERSLAVARRIKAGFMGVNGGAPYGADTPFGGYKESGVGRQNGVAGFDQYTEIKSVGIRLADPLVAASARVRSTPHRAAFCARSAWNRSARWPLMSWCTVAATVAGATNPSRGSCGAKGTRCTPLR